MCASEEPVARAKIRPTNQKNDLIGTTEVVP